MSLKEFRDQTRPSAESRMQEIQRLRDLADKLSAENFVMRTALANIASIPLEWADPLAAKGIASRTLRALPPT